MSNQDWQARTIAVTNGIDTDSAMGAVTPPLYLSSNFSFAGFKNARPYDYTRSGNPSRDLLADTIAKLEHGVGAVVVSSGMAALDLILGLVRPADLVIAPHDCYGGTFRLLTERCSRGHFDLAFVNQNDDEALSAVLARSPALLFIESPSNPLMRVLDIRKVAGLAKAAGAKVAVDNTFLSPALQQPIRLGADFVIHSTTKYLNGHSDVVGGAVVASDKGDLEALRLWANTTGVTGAPFDAYLTLRGMRTLFARMEAQQVTAQRIAEFLHGHPLVGAVYYPGLPSHPGHDIARQQQSGFGAMLSFELKGGSNEVRAFVENLEVFTLAESLGGVESLIAHPATMTHASMGADAQKIAGIGETLLRASIGLEAQSDLIGDLKRGFAAISGSEPRL